MRREKVPAKGVLSVATLPRYPPSLPLGRKDRAARETRRRRSNRRGVIQVETKVRRGFTQAAAAGVSWPLVRQVKAPERGVAPRGILDARHSAPSLWPRSVTIACRRESAAYALPRIAALGKEHGVHKTGEIMRSVARGLAPALKRRIICFISPVFD